MAGSRAAKMIHHYSCCCIYALRDVSCSPLLDLGFRKLLLL